ncbi:MAG: hypothetical protein NT010_15515 [Proteobacteria bacterium]|nr:hypothetical protein [Pseudomonadota bacterium]
MKKLITFSLLLFTGLFLYSCSTACKCSTPPINVDDNLPLIQFEEKK